jgi:threonine dehydrogenase-like Zn-dependent dehydrogenase
MRALCWHGKGDVRVDTVSDPTIQNPRDAIIRITACAICGSDLHLLDGYQPTMESGDILGHENMGEVVELGSGVTNLKVGDRVVVPFTISCGECWFCHQGLELDGWRKDLRFRLRNGLTSTALMFAAIAHWIASKAFSCSSVSLGVFMFTMTPAMTISGSC